MLCLVAVFLSFLSCLASALGNGFTYLASTAYDLILLIIIKLGYLVFSLVVFAISFSFHFLFYEIKYIALTVFAVLRFPIQILVAHPRVVTTYWAISIFSAVLFVWCEIKRCKLQKRQLFINHLEQLYLARAQAILDEAARIDYEKAEKERAEADRKARNERALREKRAENEHKCQHHDSKFASSIPRSTLPRHFTPTSVPVKTPNQSIPVRAAEPTFIKPIAPIVVLTSLSSAGSSRKHSNEVIPALPVIDLPVLDLPVLDLPVINLPVTDVVPVIELVPVLLPVVDVVPVIDLLPVQLVQTITSVNDPEVSWSDSAVVISTPEVSTITSNLITSVTEASSFTWDFETAQRPRSDVLLAHSSKSSTPLAPASEPTDMDMDIDDTFDSSTLHTPSLSPSASSDAGSGLQTPPALSLYDRQLSFERYREPIWPAKITPTEEHGEWPECTSQASSEVSFKQHRLRYEMDLLDFFNDTEEDMSMDVDAAPLVVERLPVEYADWDM